MVKWESGRRSENVEDRRSMGPGKMAAGGGISIIMLIIVFVVSGGDLGKVLKFAQQQQAAPQQQQANDEPVDPREAKLADYVTVILADTEDVWTKLMPKFNKEYRAPTLVLFRGEVLSACGQASSSSGPFYCSGDEKLYIDLSFYQELQDKFGAPGDFAQAYVVAHEVGHHVQNLLGLTTKVHRQQQQSSKEEANELSVRLELQADFLAGIWAHHARESNNIRLERGDIDEGLNAASMIGDDTLQKRAQGYVVPESFTHGSSEQRVRWFKKGYEGGDITQLMDAFNDPTL